MIYDNLKIIERKWGIEAYNDLLKVFGSQEQRIEEIKKSREKWRAKYFKLKREKDEIN